MKKGVFFNIGKVILFFHFLLTELLTACKHGLLIFFTYLYMIVLRMCKCVSV